MTFLKIIQTILLGIVEGITEWLPISSTGHMILTNGFMKIGENDFFNSQIYLYVIQLGAILAIVTLYFRKLNPFAPSKSVQEKRDTWQMWFKVIAACLPAAIFGLLLNDYMDRFSTPIVVSITLIIYGIAFIVIENIGSKIMVTDINSMTYKTAFFIGLFQVLSIIPGTSRSGSTILGAIILGCSRSVSAEFSFFLAIPVMVGVSVLKIGSYFKGVYIDGNAPVTSNEWILLIIGMAVAYAVSIIAVKFLMSYVRKHDFKAFGWYRIALGAVVVACTCLGFI
ncbi:MAG: undecaprenyl-diphosphate phosphatase [Clostridia bacterium]|nr:undecaprenyl-diphosphate phosphatase [Clostridia bacterium]